MDPIKVLEIRKKIDIMLPEENFYFFNASMEDQDKEESEIHRLIQDCISSRRFYIKQGTLEPIHHKEGEKKIIIDQMQSLFARCAKELID